MNFTESAEYVGQAVAALARDRNGPEKSGQILPVAEEDGFTGIDG